MRAFRDKVVLRADRRVVTRSAGREEGDLGSSDEAGFLDQFQAGVPAFGLMRVVESGVGLQGGDGLHGTVVLHRPGAETEAAVVVDGQVSAGNVAVSDADTVLVALSQSSGHRLRLIELAGRTLWSKSRLSHQLTRMEHRGLVRREAHAENSRATDAVLTTDGLRAIEKAAPKHVDSVRRHFIDLLTDDQITALGDTTEKVVDHLRTLRETEH